MIGKYEKDIFSDEKSTIKNLSRGVFAKNNIKKNTKLSEKNIYFAFPLQKNQLSSQDLKNNTILKKSISKDSPIRTNEVTFDRNLIAEYKVRSYLHKAKAMLNYNNIKVGKYFDLEISHHRGIENFEKVGCFLFNIVNREYAKKLLVMLPNQKHPSHFHKTKSETFIVISGSLRLIDGKNKYILYPGEIVHLKKSNWHEFKAGKKGCIFEEISTTSFKKDSFYKNKMIKKMELDERKTYVNNWFSVQLNNKIKT